MADGGIKDKMMHISAQDDPWPIDQPARNALENLSEHDLLKLVVNFDAGEIQYVGLDQAVGPDSIKQHFASPHPQDFYFYRLPVQGAVQGAQAPSRVVLIYTSARVGISAKRLYPQAQRRRDLARLALEIGIGPLFTMRVDSEADVSGALLLEATVDKTLSAT